MPGLSKGFRGFGADSADSTGTPLAPSAVSPSLPPNTIWIWDSLEGFALRSDPEACRSRVGEAVAIEVRGHEFEPESALRPGLTRPTSLGGDPLLAVVEVVQHREAPSSRER